MAINNAVALEMRDKGQFPISIGTSLAFEGLFGIYPERPNQTVLTADYQGIWINVRTLFRNLQGAMKKEDEGDMTASDYAAGLAEEMMLIQNILQSKTNGRMRAFFYACHYRNLKAFYKEAVIKEDKTDKQKHYSAMENRTLDALAKEQMPYSQEKLMSFDTTIQGNGLKTLFITHYPIDLLNAEGFSEVALLETHSGVIKKKGDWYTKLNGGKTLVRIPFNKMTIQMFGDSGGMFSPYPHEYRKAIMDIADKHQWSPMTTKDRILLTVSLSKMPTLIGTVQKMYA